VTDTLALQLFTHKSYDHGQTPYNDKLAFMGTRTLHAALCLHLASRSSQSPLAIAGKDINAIYKPVLLDTLGHYNLAAIAGTLGLDASLLRWKPANPKDLKASGLARAQSDALLAVIGWLDLSVGTRQAQAFCQNKVIPGLLSAKSQNE
jgi:large subunit ribosomal protein L15